MKFLLTLFSFALCVSSYPLFTCPTWMQQSGVMNDLAVLADSVSSFPCYTHVNGVCNVYTCIQEIDGLYQTRIRIYENLSGDKFVVFRPTQQTPEGTAIHVDRQMVSCQFLGDHCSGFVLEKFQNAFLSLINQVDRGIWDSHHYIYTTGHSLGASFSVMMGIYLFNLFNINPRIILNMAGPFFGDAEFNTIYLEPLHEIMRDRFWMISTINKNDLSEFDGTIEGYNTPGSPFINIEQNVLCGIPIPKLEDSYGMHDLRNYQLFFTGKDCVLTYGD